MSSIKQIVIWRFNARQFDGSASVDVVIKRRGRKIELELPLPARPTCHEQWRDLSILALATKLRLSRREVVSCTFRHRNWLNASHVWDSEDIVPVDDSRSPLPPHQSAFLGTERARLEDGEIPGHVVPVD